MTNATIEALFKLPTQRLTIASVGERFDGSPEWPTTVLSVLAEGEQGFIAFRFSSWDRDAIKGLCVLDVKVSGAFHQSGYRAQQHTFKAGLEYTLGKGPCLAKGDVGTAALVTLAVPEAVPAPPEPAPVEAPPAPWLPKKGDLVRHYMGSLYQVLDVVDRSDGTSTVHYESAEGSHPFRTTLDGFFTRVDYKGSRVPLFTQVPVPAAKGYNLPKIPDPYTPFAAARPTMKLLEKGAEEGIPGWKEALAILKGERASLPVDLGDALILAFREAGWSLTATWRQGTKMVEINL